MPITVRTYEASNAYGSVEQFEVDPAVFTVFDLLCKLQKSPKLYNQHVRVGMRLMTYHDHVPGELINDLEKDPTVLCKTLDELRQSGVLQYEHENTRLHVLIDGCQTEQEVAAFQLEQPLRADYKHCCLMREVRALQEEQDVIVRTVAVMAKERLEASQPDLNPALTLLSCIAFDVAMKSNKASLNVLRKALVSNPQIKPAEAGVLISSIRQKTDNSTPLHEAAACGNTDMARVLVKELKSDVKAVDKEGRTSLHFAASNGHADTVRVLVTELKSDVKAVTTDGSTALHLAASNGHADTVRVLVTELKSDVKAVNEDGSTPLHLAASNGHADTVRLLVTELKSDVTAVGGLGQTPLHLAARYGYVDTVRVLVKELKSDVKGVDGLGQTPLHDAAAKGHVDTVRVLVTELKSDVKGVDCLGQTPLHNAAANGHVDTVRVLVKELNSDIKAKDSSSNTPLHLAAESGHDAVICVLVRELGADVSARDWLWRTPQSVCKTKWPL